MKAAALRAEISANVSHISLVMGMPLALDRGAPIHPVQKTLAYASEATTVKYLDASPTESGSKYLGI